MAEETHCDSGAIVILEREKSTHKSLDPDPTFQTIFAGGVAVVLPPELCWRRRWPWQRVSQRPSALPVWAGTCPVYWAACWWDGMSFLCAQDKERVTQTGGKCIHFFKIRRWQAIKTWFSELKRERGHTSLFFGVIKKVGWTYGAASSKSVQFGSGLVLKNICKKDLKRYQLNFKKSKYGVHVKQVLLWYLRVVLFPEVHVGRDGFRVSKLHLSFSRVNNRNWFSSGWRSTSKRVDADHDKTKNRDVFVFFKFRHSSLSHVIFFWHLKTLTHSLNLFPFLYLVKYFYLHGWNKSYFSSTDVIVEVRKKSGSGFLLSFIQPFSSPSSSHRERNLLGRLSGREKLMKE